MLLKSWLHYMRLLVLLFTAVALVCAGQKKKDQELPTQVLEELKEPPSTVAVDPARLVFRVAPLSTQGLLSQQIRNALKWLMKQDRNIVKLRAFVAGTGDVRRVQAIVSEVFTEKRLALPALTVVQAGALPAPGAQVVIEATALSKRSPNPDGLAFVSGIGPVVNRPLEPIRPLAEQALSELHATLAAASIQPADVLSVTCYTTSLEAADYVRQRLASTYPAAAWNIVQQSRDPVRTTAVCEAVGRLRKAPPQPVAVSDGTARVAILNAPKVIITGAQLAFGTEDKDLQLAFERLGKALDQAGSSPDRAFVVNTYPLSWHVAERVNKLRLATDGRETPPAGTTLVCEGLPSIDASLAVEMIAVAR